MSNKLRQMEHGNGGNRNNVNIIHWNIGSWAWERKKLEVEAVIAQYQSDLFVITEANMMTDLDEHINSIDGYEMILPRTVEVRKASKDCHVGKRGLEVQVQHDLMDTAVAAIWLKVGKKGEKIPAGWCSIQGT